MNRIVMRKTLAEIAEFIEGEVIGDRNLVITGLCGIKEGQEGDLTFVANSKYFPLAEKTRASAIITPREMTVSGKSIIRTDNPSLAFAKMASLVLGIEHHQIQGIHPASAIAPTAKLGKNVAVGPFTVIEDHVRVGDETVITSGCFIGHHTSIGEKNFIFPNTIIRERISIGNRVIIHSGTVIGSDGFGFTNHQGALEKIPQLGTVIIEDDVEIGACVTIDRARFDKTSIGRGTKIDNLVHIAHNVIIEENCIIIAQVGISGSVRVQRNSILAGQAGVNGHLTIGEGSVVMSRTGVTKSVPPHTTVFGFPAKPERIAKKVNAHVQRLPHYVKVINDLKKRIEELEAKLNNKQA